ncbi:Helix-turn-helix [Marinitoga hydrogenitolerans DSM 16785]|uniref:Helix-turn-helix n=1 Tax=Marinitoga hydrogenitolerans (strain DSM 16785 / JCM 12826 / AT1271) TaxID=1122195 RepID=A0A1M4TAS2_MARH1|nr:helix-turn-helix transcriptional regulator [Marinitoga hydrogenitolerans]SHE41561.1 Helix-turn-helix [Marinitoga hydrogenitolerans DSM 16785]
MRKKNQEIFHILAYYGSFAKPFLNLMILKTTHDGWHHLFKSLEYDWKRNRKEALIEIEKGLIHNNSKTLHYILLAKKLSYLFLIKDYDNAKNLYFYLKENYSKIPKNSRKIVSSVLINIENIMEWNEKTRLWGKIYESDPSTEAFIYLGKARKKIKGKEYEDAWKYFEKSYKLSKEIPHRVGIINSLNDWSWYLKSFDLEKAIYLSKKLMYYTGYYFENNMNYFDIFDTFFEVNNENIGKLYSYAPIISYYWGRLPEKGKRNSKENYVSMFNYLKKFVVTKESSYKITEELRTFIKNYIVNISEVSKKINISRKSLSAIINGKVKEIKGNTIRKLIVGLNITPDIFSPFAIINEYGKLYFEKEFNKVVIKLKEMDFEKRKRLFVHMYIASLNKPNVILSDIKDLTFSDDFYVKWFIIEMLKGNEFINARKELARHFFERMKKSSYNEFIANYFNLNKKEKKLMDIFVRNYSRYDIKWNIRIELPEFLIRIVEKYSLKKMPTTLSYWYYENGADRRKLLNILTKF